MSREIKFRAWDGFKMHIEYRATFWNNKSMGVGWSVDAISKGDAVLMQFTGLKDKNGVECFESDLIVFEIGEFVVRAEVIFERGAFLVKQNDEYLTLDDINEGDNDLILNKGFQVIGNIYEHPNLL